MPYRLSQELGQAKYESDGLKEEKREEDSRGEGGGGLEQAGLVVTKPQLFLGQIPQALHDMETALPADLKTAWQSPTCSLAKEHVIHWSQPG